MARLKGSKKPDILKSKSGFYNVKNAFREYAFLGNQSGRCNMLKLNSLLLFSEAPKKLVDFYRQVLASDPKWQEDEFNGFECGASALVIGPHSKVHGQSENPERIMVNFET